MDKHVLWYYHLVSKVFYGRTETISMSVLRTFEGLRRNRWRRLWADIAADEVLTLLIYLLLYRLEVFIFIHIQRLENWNVLLTDLLACDAMQQVLSSLQDFTISAFDIRCTSSHRVAAAELGVDGNAASSKESQSVHISPSCQNRCNWVNRAWSGREDYAEIWAHSH